MLRRHSPRFTGRPKGQDFKLALRQVESPDPTGWVKNASLGGPSIVLRVDDCRNRFAEMKSRGVRFTQAQTEEYNWGSSATFADPDGNLFLINQLPANGVATAMTSTKSTTAMSKKSKTFTAEERDAIKVRVREIPRTRRREKASCSRRSLRCQNRIAY